MALSRSIRRGLQSDGLEFILGAGRFVAQSHRVRLAQGGNDASRECIFLNLARARPSPTFRLARRSSHHVEALELDRLPAHLIVPAAAMSASRWRRV